MLALDLEFLSGVCYAASEHGPSVAEFPPQADRVFSALVAAWAHRGEDPAERSALEWLEAQAPPRITASGYHARTSVDVFVPPNDDRTAKEGNLRVLPSHRRRQPRRFPAAVPFDATARLEWEAEPDDETFARLAAIASDVVYVGHSASLVRAYVRREMRSGPTGTPSRRAPYAGRLAELERAFRSGERPSRGAVVIAPSPPMPRTEPPRTFFGTDWIVLPGIAASLQGDDPHERDLVPDARASAFVTKRLRDAIMSTFGHEGVDVPEWISGHSPTGAPSEAPHLAIVPMLDVGHPYASGNLLGLGLIPPASIADADSVLIRALVKLRTRSGNEVRPQIALQFAQGRWRLALTDDDARPSLDPRPYVGAPNGARRWTTVTPIVLDRHLKARGAEQRDQEIIGIVSCAVQRLGLPEPVTVVVDKNGAAAGSVQASPPRGAPSWTQWAKTEAFGSRPLTHAVIEFSEPVRGPIVVGAGRYYGLGLCRALDDARHDA